MLIGTLGPCTIAFGTANKDVVTWRGVRLATSWILLAVLDAVYPLTNEQDKHRHQTSPPVPLPDELDET